MTTLVLCYFILLWSVDIRQLIKNSFLMKSWLKCMIEKIISIFGTKLSYGCHRSSFYHITKLMYDMTKIIFPWVEITKWL